ncbi:hypothetical protein H5410_004159 [Solanum commersonii]|uniref:Uncharacterized protein n=1 Tax=Solanum commersonii TaxID=4109 RepID=A0A9J6B759_SOLCO|nr:hypothetical protein H5410_004159 [Solanum commersonii]
MKIGICPMKEISSTTPISDVMIEKIDHKWTPKIGFTEEIIPCLYRTYYNNFWDKLMKQDPKTK